MSSQRRGTRLTNQQNADRLEDVRWMADTGEGFTAAAARLGITVKAFEAWCGDHCPDLARRLKAQEPRDHNRVTGNQHAPRSGWRWNVSREDVAS